MTLYSKPSTEYWVIGSQSLSTKLKKLEFVFRTVRPNSLNLTIAYVRFIKGRQAVTGTTWTNFYWKTFHKYWRQPWAELLLQHAFELLSKDSPRSNLQPHFKKRDTTIFEFLFKHVFMFFSRRNIFWTTFSAPATCTKWVVDFAAFCQHCCDLMSSTISCSNLTYTKWVPDL